MMILGGACKWCGRACRWQVQRTIDGKDEPITEQRCGATERSGKLHCEPRTPADSMVADLARRANAKFSRTSGGRK